MSLNFISMLYVSLDRSQERRSMGNCVDHEPTVLPAVGEAVTLVVGNDLEFKRRVAHSIAEALGAAKEEVSRAGVRIFTRESSPAVPVVVDTLPLSTVKDWGRVDTARVWISQNSLRRLCGQLVVVVCVITSTDPSDDIYREPDFEFNRFSWLHLLALIFEQHKKEIIIIVNSEDTIDEASKRTPRLREILRRDGFQDNTIKVFDFERGELNPTINSILHHAFCRGKANDEFDHETTAGSKSTIEEPFLLREVAPDHETTAGSKSTIAEPFLLLEVAPNASEKDRFGPWGPENIILFGRTGSGKSTLAQMLTSGKLDARSTQFSFGSTIRGETKVVKYGQGRGWRVIDTPGLGESINDAQSTVTTAEAGRLIKEYVLLREGTYTHFIYVWRNARLDDLDERLWEVFVKMFGAEIIKTHMTIVVSDAEQDWLDDNVTHLRKTFGGCESFTTAYFPRPDEDAEIETEIQELRLESLRALEDDLASLGRIDRCCKLGKWSVGTELSMSIRGADEHVTPRSHIRQSPAFGSAVAPPQPSDYETARVVIRLKSMTSKIGATCLPWEK